MRGARGVPPSEPEVDQVEPPGVIAPAEDEVGWLDVAVKEPFAMNVLDRVYLRVPSILGQYS